MTTTEERLRTRFQEMADEAQPAALLSRLDDRAPAMRRRRLVVAGVAAAAVVAVAVSTAFVQSRLTSMPQPAYEPPPVFELGSSESARPGIAWMAVTVGAQAQATVFVTPVGGGGVIAVPPSDGTAEGYFTQRLSPDGSYLASAVDFSGDIAARVDVQDLRTGQVVELDHWAFFAERSPDNRTVAAFVDGEVRVVDVATGAGRTVRRLPLHTEADPTVPGLGWAPDGSKLAIHDGDDLAIVDSQGTEEHLFAGAHLTNGSQSWSPDSESLLVFEDGQSGFVVRPVDGGPPTALTA